MVWRVANVRVRMQAHETFCLGVAARRGHVHGVGYPQPLLDIVNAWETERPVGFLARNRFYLG